VILRGWHIDGFGQWRDHRIDDLAPGLNVLHGPNEIGKTTLHAFVRGVLFGFPDRRSRDPLYLPIHGGEHGGRLLLDTAEGRVSVGRWSRNRRVVVVENEAGERLDAGWLDRRLRGVDGALFRSVFAFGLEELSGLDALGAEEVGLRIFDAGLEGAGRSVAAVVEELQKRREAEHRSRGGRIRELAREVLAARTELNGAIAAARGHRALAAAEAEAAALLEARRAELEAARGELQRWEILLSLWPVELRRRAALREAAGIGLEEAAALEARLVTLRAEQELQHDRRRRIEALRRAAAAERAAAREALAALGPGWTEERLLALDRSAERRASFARHRAAIDAATRAVEAASAERERCAAEVARLEGERAALEEGAVGEVPRAEELRVRRGALAELRAAFAAREDLLRQAVTGAPAPASGAAVGGVLFLVAAVALAMAGAWGAAAVAVVAALAALGLWGMNRRAAAAAHGSSGAAALEEASRRVERAAAACGVQPPITAAVIEGVAIDLDAAERAFHLREELLRQIEAIRTRCAGARAGLRRAEESEAAAVAARERALAAWAEAAADLGGERTVEEALELLRQVDGIVARSSAAARAEEELAAVEAAAARWEEAAATLLAAAGIEGAIPQGLELLEGRLARARAAQAAAAQLDEQLGVDERGAQLRAELERGERGHWEEAAAEVRERIAALEAEVDAALERLTLRRREREELERSADVPAKAAALASREEELAAAVRRYREAALLEKVLLQALERFQQERQPEVLRHASDAFARITAGRWVAVRQPVGVKEVEVIDADGRAVAAGALSRGAVEQLYLSVRLGLVAAFADRGLRLPLLLDDVCVNFDPARADATAAVIADFAREHQVLLFTCHPQTVERMVAAAPECRVVALEPARGARVDVA